MEHHIILDFQLIKFHFDIWNIYFGSHLFNPIWTGHFDNLKRPGEGQFGPPLNLAISSQITMKLGKDILWVETVTNWQKIMMTSSKCNSWKNGSFSRVLAEYLKNCSTDFHQTYAILVFEIKRSNIGHSLLPW